MSKCTRDSARRPPAHSPGTNSIPDRSPVACRFRPPLSALATAGPSGAATPAPTRVSAGSNACADPVSNRTCTLMVANGNPPAAQRVYNSSVRCANIMRRAVIAGLACAAAAAAQVGVAGRVIDEDGAPVPAARVAVHCGALPAIEAQTGPAGLFQMSLPPGGCTLNARSEEHTSELQSLR